VFRGVSFFIGGLYLEPLVFRCASFFYQTSFVRSHLCLEVSLFSSEMFYLNPLMYRGASFFLSEIFIWIPLRLGVHLSSSKVFYLEPLVFRGASFFLGCLCFEQTNESCNNAPSFVTLAYQAYQLLSNTELMVIAILTMVKRVRPSLGLIIVAFSIKLVLVGQ
jgi:hypothetical protein